MAKKSSFRFLYDSPVSLSIVIASLLIFILDSLAFKGSLIQAAFTCHGNSASDIPFNFSSPVEYIRLITYALGNYSWESLLISSIFILLLGPLMEERYGSVMLAVMMAISTFVAGVLNACLIPQDLKGQSAIVFMLILLSVLTTLEKKEIPLSWILLFVTYLAQQMHFAAMNFTTGTRLSDFAFISFMQKNVGTFTLLAAGITGTLFGFLVAPKTKTSQTKTYKFSGTTPRPMATPYDKPNPYDGTSIAVSQEELDRLESQSPRFKKKGKSKDEKIGTLSF